MEKSTALQSKNFRKLYRYIQLALKLKVNFIISGNFDNLFDFRHPRALVSVCHTLLEMPLAKAKNAFSNNPKLLVKRALSRSSKSYIENGVRLIKDTE
jgi:RNase P/RNase MRP subunit p30